MNVICREVFIVTLGLAAQKNEGQNLLGENRGRGVDPTKLFTS